MIPSNLDECFVKLSALLGRDEQIECDFTITIDENGNIHNANGFVIGHIDPKKQKELLIMSLNK